MNQKIRNVFFWLHLGLGIAAGAVIFVMSITGTLLAFERQITDWADRGFRSSPLPEGSSPLSAEALLANFQKAKPGAPPTGLSLQSDPSAPALINQGREHAYYLDRTTGAVLGEGSQRVRGFFRSMTDWHRWLAVEGVGRAKARMVTGASNLIFLFIVLSGLYLWLPRKWNRRQLRNITWFRGGLTAKARDFNWHNVVGLWLWVPLVLVVASGVVISFPWAGDLVYRLAGEEPPAREGGGRRGPGGPAGSGSGSGRAEEAVSYTGLDALWSRAEAQVPGWKTLTVRLSEADAETVAFTILSGQRGRPDLRAQLTLDRESGETKKWETYSQQSRGRKVRGWLRWIHTGEAGGGMGQTIALVASAGAALLVWTGWAMSWRRFFPRRPRRGPSEPVEAGDEIRD